MPSKFFRSVGGIFSEMLFSGGAYEARAAIMGPNLGDHLKFLRNPNLVHVCLEEHVCWWFIGPLTLDVIIGPRYIFDS